MRLTHIAPLLAALFAVGCGSTSFRLRIVDGDTGVPLAGVRTWAATAGYYADNRLFPDGESMTCPATGADGIADAPDRLPEPDFSTHFRLERDGYQRALLTDAFDGSTWSVRAFPGKFDENPSHADRVRSPVDGRTVTVPMYKVGR